MAETTKRVFIARKMNLNIDGTITTYEAGRHHELPASYAESDYVLAHTDNPPEFKPKEGTPEWAAYKRDKEATQLLLEKVMAEQATKNMQSPKRGR